MGVIITISIDKPDGYKLVCWLERIIGIVINIELGNCEGPGSSKFLPQSSSKRSLIVMLELYWKSSMIFVLDEPKNYVDI